MSFKPRFYILAT